jgi:hypothetical protein
MSHAVYKEDSIPRPPRLRPTWTTWMWVAFMIAVVAFTVVGLWTGVR